MTSSLTVTFSGSAPLLQTYFLPEITLDEDCDYSCAFLDLIIKDKDTAKLNAINNLNVICVNCDIISGSYINGEQKHIIYQFATRTSTVKGQTFVQIPKHLNYFPVKTKNLRSIQISILDLDGKVVNTGGANIICRINIKRDGVVKFD